MGELTVLPVGRCFFSVKNKNVILSDNLKRRITEKPWISDGIFILIVYKMKHCIIKNIIAIRIL